MNEAGQAKPPLLAVELQVGRVFRPLAFECTADFVRKYAEVTGDRDPVYLEPAAARSAGYGGCLVPLGVAGMLARMAYLQDHTMPAGGVLVGQSIRFHRHAVVGERLAVVARVAAVTPRGDSSSVTFTVSFRDERKGLVVEVELRAIWPPDPAVTT